MYNNNFTVIDVSYKGINYYGVEIKTGNGDIYKYDVISPCKDEVMQLAERLSTANDISPVHFNDIVRDYITELYLSVIDANKLA